MKKCENCNELHEGVYGSGRFCSQECARSYSTKLKRNSINETVSKRLLGRKLSNETKKKISKNNGKYWEGKDGYWKGKKRPDIKNKYAGKTTLKKCKKCKEKTYIAIFGSVCDTCKGEYRLYKEKCKFNFNIFDYPKHFDLSLIEKYGWYSAKNKGNNLNGISRDHKISVYSGWINNINSNIISHPANCELVRHNKNQRKNIKCSITLKQLEESINKWVSA